MLMIDNACHYCKKRHLNCHSTCVEYREFKEKLELARKREKTVIINDTIEYEGIENRRKGTRRK